MPYDLSKELNTKTEKIYPRSVWRPRQTFLFLRKNR